jgi:hypothetical protein
VREAWDEAIARRRGVWVEEQAEWGSVVSQQLMTLADNIHSDSAQTSTALAEAQIAITQATTAA